MRNKIYYPKSHIVTNLVTTGKEWMFEDGTEYIGYYHKYVEGLRMSGAVYDKNDSKKLIPYVDQVIQPYNKVYNELMSKSRFTIVPHVAPRYKYPTPTEEEYAAGFMIRYLLRKRNYNNFTDILEIDLPQFKLWRQKNFGIDENLYDGLELPWKLTGPERDVKDVSGMIVTYGVYDTNQRMVNLKDAEFGGLKEFLTDFTEVTIYSKVTSQSIKDLYLIK